MVNSISGLILKLTGAKIEEKKEVFDYYDLFDYVEEDVNRHEDDSEIDLDTNILKKAIELPNIKIRECMVPRTELQAIEKSDSLDNLKQLFLNTGHSKILVYEDNIDQVTGFVHMIDLYENPSSISSIVRPVNIFPESMPANELLKRFINSKKSIGLVVDEFGGTAGIVTIEDLLEEILGEITDEHDTQELRDVQVSENEFIFSARLEIDYLNEKYELGLPEGDYETLGGYILEVYQSIPSQNETIKVDKFEFKILSAFENRIEEVDMKINVDKAAEPDT